MCIQTTRFDRLRPLYLSAISILAGLDLTYFCFAGISLVCMDGKLRARADAYALDNIGLTFQQVNKLDASSQ